MFFCRGNPLLCVCLAEEILSPKGNTQRLETYTDVTSSKSEACFRGRVHTSIRSQYSLPEKLLINYLQKKETLGSSRLKKTALIVFSRL